VWSRTTTRSKLSENRLSMNILITGGSGFVGTRLVGELLQAGHQVAIFDTAPSAAHPELSIRGDLRDAEALSRAAAGRDAIIHLAAEHRDDVRPVSLYQDVNVGGAVNVTAAARLAGCRRIIFTSSVAVYPLNYPAPTEDTQPRPFNPYGESKLKAEEIFRRWAQDTPGASLAIVRLCVVFGEGNRGNVYNLLSQIHRRRFLMVGRGQNRKSMAYVGNVIHFVIRCLDLPAGTHLYNYADKPDLSVAELVAHAQTALGRSEATSRLRLPFWLGLGAGLVLDGVSKVTGRRFPISAIRIRKFCADTTVSTARLEMTGFGRPYSLEEALLGTVRHEFGHSARPRAAQPRGAEP
jgi:GlcNAc-P-P-Und epimerase